MVKIQYELGQRAFIGGLWVNNWTTAQNDFQKTQKSKKKHRISIIVIVMMIKRVQKLLREMWNSQNEVLHKDKQSRYLQSRIMKVHNMITSLFQRKEHIPRNQLAAADRKYFQRQIQVIKKMKLTRKERCTQDAEAILNKYDEENESAQIRAFRSYFMHRDDG